MFTCDFPLTLQWPATAQIGVQLDDIEYHDGDIMRVRYDTREVLIMSIAPLMGVDAAVALCEGETC